MAKLLGKGAHVKKKSVTIIHSATTETVRLPDDNNGVCAISLSKPSTSNTQILSTPTHLGHRSHCNPNQSAAQKEGSR